MRVRFIDAKIKDSADISMMVNPSEMSGIDSLGRMFKYSESFTPNRQYALAEAIYVLKSSTFHMSIQATFSDILDMCEIKYRNVEDFLVDDDYDFGEFVDYDDYLKNLLPSTLERIKSIQAVVDDIFLELWV